MRWEGLHSEGRGGAGGSDLGDDEDRGENEEEAYDETPFRGTKGTRRGRSRPLTHIIHELDRRYVFIVEELDN